MFDDVWESTRKRKREGKTKQRAESAWERAQFIWHGHVDAVVRLVCAFTPRWRSSSIAVWLSCSATASHKLLPVTWFQCQGRVHEICPIWVHFYVLLTRHVQNKPIKSKQHSCFKVPIDLCFAVFFRCLTHRLLSLSNYFIKLASFSVRFWSSLAPQLGDFMCQKNKRFAQTKRIKGQVFCKTTRFYLCLWFDWCFVVIPQLPKESFIQIKGAIDIVIFALTADPEAVMAVLATTYFWNIPETFSTSKDETKSIWKSLVEGLLQECWKGELFL